MREKWKIKNERQMREMMRDENRETDERHDERHDGQIMRDMMGR